MSAFVANPFHRVLNRHENAGRQPRLLHFYFSSEQRRILVREALQPLRPADSVVLGCGREDLDFYRGIFQAAAGAPRVTYVPLTRDWHRSLCNLLEACFTEQKGRVVVLADFATLAAADEVEAVAQWLEHGMRNTDIAWIAQFDGVLFSERFLASRLRDSAALLFDGFYCRPAAKPDESKPARTASRKPSVDMAAD